MTRASPATAVIMARATTSRKSGSGGNYPQWMRTLEEKYQKLHKKITENTGIGHHRFSHQVGRSVYDCRLSHAIQRYRDISTAKQTFISSANSKKGDQQADDGATNPGETGLSSHSQISPQNQQTPLTPADIVNSTANNDVTNYNPGTQGAELSAGNDGGGLIEPEHHVTSSSSAGSDVDLAEAVYDRGSGRADSGARTGGEQEDNQSTWDDHRGDVTTRTHNTRNVKTSLSRSSKVTSKSCPAKIQSRNIAISRPTTKTLLSRSKSAQKTSNMYIQMSEEAKHAITETIHEMNIGDKRAPCSREITFIPSRERRTIKTWVVPKKSRGEKSYSASKVIEGASRKLRGFHDDGASPAGVGNESCRSSAGSSFHKVGSAILPDIQTEGSRDIIVTNNSMRLPGIGKYDINEVNDNFEITPPGFDSRYNDVLPVEERESETPPPDIRQRAIDKCSEWLTKYSK